MVLKVLLLLTTMLAFSAISISSPGGEQTPQGMVLVKGGPFRMGTDERVTDEEPVHSVTLDSFYIGKYEVTQEEWKSVMGNNPSIFKGDNFPVDNVDWYDAVEYCNKKSLKEGFTPCYKRSSDDITCDFSADGFRLPTEAEWEYACRGGLKSRNYMYSGSNNPDEIGWCTKNATFKTEAVGQKKPNELGIYDMSGNVWEWCWDWFNRDYYKNSLPDNPTGPFSGLRRVIRGGSVNSSEETMESTFRIGIKPIRLSRGFGLRVVRTAK